MVHHVGGTERGMELMIENDLTNATTTAGPVQSAKPDVNKGGRPRGFDGRRAKMPSAMAQAFKRAGLDWQVDFANAIKANNRNRIKLWLRLLPYLITTSAKSRVKKWKGRPSRAAMIALETLEGKSE